jgi:ATP synthase protein I
MSPDLNDLGHKLDEIQGHKTAEAQKHAQNMNDAENMSNGMRAGAELVGAVIAGALIGYGLDSAFGSKPLCLIIFLLLGIFTGFYNVWRTTQNIGSSVGFSELHRRKKDAKTSPDKK